MPYLVNPVTCTTSATIVSDLYVGSIFAGQLTCGATSLTYGGTASTVNWDWSSHGTYATYSSLTPQQQAEWETSRIARFTEQEQRQAAYEVAAARATKLLLSLLSPAQQASYIRDRTFTVLGSAGGIYRIRPGSAGNVDWIDPTNTGREIAGVLCAHPQLWTPEGFLPDPDVALAQMLALTTDEPRFVATANVHRGRRPLIAA